MGFVEASPSLLARCVPAAKSRWIGHDSDSGIWKKQQQQKNSPSKDYNNQNMFSVTNELTTVGEMGSRIFDCVFWILCGLSQSAYKLRITFSWTKILINKKLASKGGWIQAPGWSCLPSGNRAGSFLWLLFMTTQPAPLAGIPVYAGVNAGIKFYLGRSEHGHVINHLDLANCVLLYLLNLKIKHVRK